MGRLTPGLGNPVFLPFIVSVSSPVSTQLQSNLSKFGEKSQGTWTAGPGVFGRGPSCWSLGADGLLEVYLGNSQLQGCLAVWPWVGPKASALQLFLTGTGSHHRVRRGLGSLREQVHLREEPPKGASWCGVPGPWTSKQLGAWPHTWRRRLPWAGAGQRKPRLGQWLPRFRP